MEYIVEAQVIDSQNLHLKRPITITPGSTVMITIVPAGQVAEDQEWYLLSARGLEAAYGENEPEYTLDLIKSPNPEYYHGQHRIDLTQTA